MKTITIFILTFLISGCVGTLDHVPKTKQELADEITFEAALKIKKKTCLIPCGIGGQMMKQIKMIGLSFDYRKPVGIEEGRRLLVEAVDELVATVNEDKRVHRYLDSYPFGPQNVEIRIFLQTPEGSIMPPGELHVITAIRGEFNYDTDNPENKLFKTILAESYDEAVAKVKL